jgi:predicted amidohydrolase
MAAIIGGAQFTVEEKDQPYNVAHLFRRDGTLGKQYKLHITPSERPWWGVVPGHGVEVETVVMHDLDIEFLRRQRYSGTVQNWTDRRRDLYRVVIRDGDTTLEV